MKLALSVLGSVLWPVKGSVVQSITVHCFIIDVQLASCNAFMKSNAEFLESRVIVDSHIQGVALFF